MRRPSVNIRMSPVYGLMLELVWFSCETQATFLCIMQPPCNHHAITMQPPVSTVWRLPHHQPFGSHCCCNMDHAITQDTRKPWPCPAVNKFTVFSTYVCNYRSCLRNFIFMFRSAIHIWTVYMHVWFRDSSCFSSPSLPFCVLPPPPKVLLRDALSKEFSGPSLGPQMTTLRCQAWRAWNHRRMLRHVGKSTRNGGL